jgi:membrane protease YdiL (CAAX protease family)
MNRESNRKIMINKNLKIAIISLILFFIAEFIATEIDCFGEGLKINFIRIYLMSTIISHICVIILQYILVKMYSNNVIEFVGMKFEKKSLKQFLVGIVIGILAIIIIVFILRFTKFIEFRKISSIHYTNIINSFFAAIIVGVVEEIVFRGIILNQLMQFKGEVFAIIISSIIFGLMHAEYYNIPTLLCYTIIFGAVAGGLYIVTKSLYLSIGLHFTINFLLWVVNEIFILNKTVSSAKFGLYLGGIEIAMLLPLLIFIVIIRIKYYAAKQVKKNQPLN